MSPYTFPGFTTNDNYGGFYESPRLRVRRQPRREGTWLTSNSEYGGFLNVPRSPRRFAPPEGSPPSPEPPPKNRSPREEALLRFDDRQIRLPDVDAVELHMRDKSKILLSVKEFYRRYLDA